MEAQDGVDFIANDCRLERGQSWFQVITGPNMVRAPHGPHAAASCFLLAVMIFV